MFICGNLPRHGSADEDLAVVDLAVEGEEILERSLGDFELRGILAGSSMGDLVRLADAVGTRQILGSICVGLLDIAGHIEGVTGGFPGW